MSECTHDCSSCGANCPSRDQQSLLEKPHAGTNIKKVIAVMSGKGGVGKSMVTALLAVLAQRAGLKTAILDADITGPSIPKAFGIKQNAMGNEEGILPVESKTGIKLMSLNLLLDDETAPVVWRGPVIAGTVKQFWTDVLWGDIDIMFIDMPPGTGDVPLTVFQSVPVNGAVVVTTPQELVQGHRGKYELRGLPGLREARVRVRRKPRRRNRPAFRRARAGQAAHQPQAHRRLRRGPDRAVRGRLAG